MILSVKRNQVLLQERAKTILRAGCKLTHDDEKMLLEARHGIDYAFIGIIPLKCKLGSYYFIDLGDDGIARHLFWLGAFGYERSSAALFTYLATKASYVIDLGAFSGYYSVLASCLAGNQNVIAIEANPYNYHRLCENLGINGCNVIAKNCAILPAGQEQQEIRVMYNSTLSSLDTGGFVDHEETDLIPQKKSKKDWFTVPALSFEELCSELQIDAALQGDSGDFVLVKLDIEGLEAPIFADILSYLNSSKLVLMVEILTQATANKILSAMGQVQSLAMAYVDDYAQTLTLLEETGFRRTLGSRNFLISTLDRLSMLAAIKIGSLLHEYE